MTYRSHTWMPGSESSVGSHVTFFTAVQSVLWRLKLRGCEAGNRSEFLTGPRDRRSPRRENDEALAISQLRRCLR